MEVESYTPICDACASEAPTWVYELPKGTVLLHTIDPKTLQETQLQSAGKYGMCAACKVILETVGFGDRGARALAYRQVEANPKLKAFTGEARKRVLTASAANFRRYIPLLKNPRAVTAKDLEGEVNLWETEKVLPREIQTDDPIVTGVACSSCGAPLAVAKSAPGPHLCSKCKS